MVTYVPGVAGPVTRPLSATPDAAPAPAGQPPFTQTVRRTAVPSALFRSRAARSTPVPPAQVVPLAPAVLRVRRPGVVLRHSTSSQPPLDQVAAPAQTRARGARPPLRRRGVSSAPVPVQAALPPPPWPPRQVLRAWRWRTARRGVSATPVPAQVNPPRLPDVVRPDWRTVIRSRGRASTPVPPQQFLGPQQTQRTTATVRRLVLGLRRGRVSTVPSPQDAPPVLAQRPATPARRVLARWWRPRVASPVRPQDSPPAGRQTPPRHPIEASARRRGSSGPPLPQAAPPAVAAVQERTPRRRLIGAARARIALGRWIGVPRVITGMHGSTSGPSAAGSVSGPSAAGSSDGPDLTGSVT